MLRSLGIAWLLGMVGSSSGCQTIDREAEQLFMQGEYSRSIESFRSRRDVSAYDFVLESSLLASAALAAGDDLTAGTALRDAAAGSGLLGRDASLPERVERARNRRALVFYRLTPDESALNSIYRALLLLRDEPDWEAAETVLQQGNQADSDSDRDTSTDIAALPLLRALTASKSKQHGQRDDFLGAFRELAGHHRCAEVGALFDANTLVWIDRGLIPERRSTEDRLPSALGSQDEVRLRFGNSEWCQPALVLDLSTSVTSPGGFQGRDRPEIKIQTRNAPTAYGECWAAL